MSTIKVNKKNIFKIFENSLIIPEYQREYVWTTENVNTLINDIINFYTLNNNKEYFLGALLLYKKKKDNNYEYEIIDGQQRVITLYLILQNLKLIQYKDNLQIYHSIFQNSKYNIITNYNHIKNKIENIKILKENIENIVFTVIETENIDDAFTFFDTHNTSGVRLNTVDLLKAYHLRAINNEKKKEKTIESIVERWDSHNANNAMKYILEDINFSIRTTKGQKLIYGSHNSASMYKKLILNNYKNNKQDKDLVYKELFINEIKYNDFENYTLINKNKYNTINIPFSIRQPIKDGYSFFEYSAKYKKLYEFLFVEKLNENDDNLYYFKDIYHNIIKHLSDYLRLVFEHLCFYYYDKFENNNIALFSVRVLDIIGYYRLKNYSIRESVYKNIIINNNIINLFDLIHTSFTTEEVIETLSTIIEILDTQKEIEYKNLNNVRKTFFKLVTSLKNDKKSKIYNILQKSLMFEKIQINEGIN